MTDPTINRKKQTGPLGRTQLTQSLINTLEAGPAEVLQQIRFMLALSQVTAAAPVPVPVTAPPYSVAEARLVALVELRHTLGNTQITQLFRDVDGIDNVGLRLRLLLLLTPHLPVEQRTRTIQDIWGQINQLADDPGLRGELLLQMFPLLDQGLDESTQVAVELSNTVKLAQNIDNAEARVRGLVALAVELPPTMKISLFNHILDEIDATQNDSLRANAINAMTDRLPVEVEARMLKSVRNIVTPHERIRALTALARTISVHNQRVVREEAIKALAQIRNEDDRAEALINFAPHLESASEADGFPQLLEQALGIAVTLSRRHIRAQALVALSPHLTLDLQGEALAAVHSLSNERDRAILLAELAPTLPPNMLVASLAVAHTMREQDARVHALTILAHYAPEHARSQTVLDALAAASNLPHHYERVTALVNLADVLPEQLLDQAFTNALETTRLIDNASARARALSLLGQHLPPHLLDRALEAAYRIGDVQMRINALTGIVPRVPVDERGPALQAMLDSAAEMTIGYKRSRALVSIAPHLTPALIRDALTIADSLDDAFDRVSAYIALVQNMPPADRPTIVEAAWKLLLKIEDGYDRSSALAAMASLLPHEMNDLLARTAANVIRAIDDEYDQASAITILASVLAQGEVLTAETRLDRVGVLRAVIQAALATPQQARRVTLMQDACKVWTRCDDEPRYALWQEFAPDIARLPLADTLYMLGVLYPVIKTFVPVNDLKNIAYILGLR